MRNLSQRWSLIIALITLCSAGAFAQVAGDYGSAATGVNWGTDGTNWLVFVSAADWSDATAAPGAPSATTNVWIRSGHTVTMEASTKACKNLTIVSGGTLLTAASGSSIAINGNAQVDGVLGSATAGPVVQFVVSGTLSGAGSFYFSKLRPNANGITITVDMNINGYTATGNFINCNNKTPFTLELKAGRTLTLPTGGYISTQSNSSTSDPGTGANVTYNVYGTINAPISTGGGIGLANLPGFTTTLNIYSGGNVNTGRLSAVTAGTGTKGSMIVNVKSGGSLTIQGAATAITNDMTRAILNVEGSFSTGTGLTSISSNTIGQLILNNSAGITLANPTTVTDTLTMTQGNIALGGNTLTLGTAIASAGSLNYTAGYITGTGTFTRWVNSTAVISGTQGLFPMGVGTHNRSLVIGGTPTIGGTVSVSYNDASTVSLISFAENTQNFVNRYDANWAVSQTGLTWTAITLAIHGDGIPGITSVSDLNVCSASAIALGVYALPSGSLASPVVNRAGLTQATLTINPFYIASTITSGLPVEMTSFTASMQSANCAILKWATATEVNNNGFEIQRRVEGTSDWAKVGFVSGAGISNSQKKYSYQDVNLAPGVYVYRIKQIDNDGTFKYSASAQVDLGVAKGFELLSNYPNPFNPETNIRFSVPEDGFASLKVFNVLGQEVATLFSGMAQAGHYIPATFNAGKMASGIYFSRLEYNGKSIVQRMLLTK